MKTTSKLFARPSGLLPDEPSLVEPSSIERVTKRIEPLGFGSLPDDLDSTDEWNEPEEPSESAEALSEHVRSARESEDLWGAAFEVDDFRTLRRMEAAAEPVHVHRQAPPRAPVPPSPNDDGDLIGMPEEGDVAEHTGVGEQVSLPEGFGADIELPSLDRADDQTEEYAAPNPAGNAPADAPEATGSAVDDFSMNWLSAGHGGPDTMPDAVAALNEALARDADPAPPPPTLLRSTSALGRRASSEPPRISARMRDQDAAGSTQPGIPPRVRPLEPPKRAAPARPTRTFGRNGPERPQPPDVHVDYTESTAEAPEQPLEPFVSTTVQTAPLSTVASELSAEAFAALLERHEAEPQHAEAGAPATPRRPMRAPAARRAAPMVAPRPAPKLTRTRTRVVAAVVATIVVLTAIIVPQLWSSPLADPTDSTPSANATPAPERVPPTPSPAPAAPEPPPPAPVAPPTKPPSRAESAIKSGTGIIRVTSDRKALIIVDGKQHGYAPGLADLSIAAGPHTVRAVESGTSITRTLEVRVDPGAAVIAGFTFAKK